MIKRLKGMHGGLLLILTAATIQGCAFGDREINLTYPQEERGTVHASGAAPTIGTVTIEPFVDLRPDKSRVGRVRNGYGMTTAQVVTEDDVLAWVADALKYELNAQGIEVGTDGELAISGELLTVFCTAYFNYEGRIAFVGTIHRGSQQISTKEYSAEGEVGTNWAATGKSFSKSLTNGLRISTLAFVSDIKQALEMEPEPVLAEQPDPENTYAIGRVLYETSIKQVTAMLKAPRDARFPGTFERRRHYQMSDENTCLIDSWVEAQNSFGATLRSKWMMKWEKQPNGDWTVTLFIFDDDRII